MRTTVQQTHLCYLPLHNDKIRVVDVELDGLEQGLNVLLEGLVSIK